MKIFFTCIVTDRHIVAASSKNISFCKQEEQQIFAIRFLIQFGQHSKGNRMQETGKVASGVRLGYQSLFVWLVADGWC
jgi:hypothetical protein